MKKAIMNLKERVQGYTEGLEGGREGIIIIIKIQSQTKNQIFF